LPILSGCQIIRCIAYHILISALAVCLQALALGPVALALALKVQALALTLRVDVLALTKTLHNTTKILQNFQLLQYGFLRKINTAITKTHREYNMAW